MKPLQSKVRTLWWYLGQGRSRASCDFSMNIKKSNYLKARTKMATQGFVELTDGKERITVNLSNILDFFPSKDGSTYVTLQHGHLNVHESYEQVTILINDAIKTGYSSTYTSFKRSKKAK